MTRKNHETRYWDHVARKMANGQEFDELLAEQYRSVHMNLLTRWADIKNNHLILKTDLFAEALCPSRAFLWDILKVDGNVVGIDISAEITSEAKIRASQRTQKFIECLNCDIRQLPFSDNSFDLIISDSTLDHYSHQNEIAIALTELRRILKPGGTIIITMDNKDNITELLFRLWIYFGLAPFFIGETYSMKQLKQAMTDIGFLLIDSTTIIHNPRLFTKLVIALVRKVAPARADPYIRKGLRLLDSLENRRTKYLTAQFIAVKAVKPAE
jgi:SAM-dependent methyltransferase